MRSFAAGGTDGGADGSADSSRQSLDGPPKNPLLAAYDMHYSAVKADPSDFSKWVSLISASEKLVRFSLSVFWERRAALALNGFYPIQSRVAESGIDCRRAVIWHAPVRCLCCHADQASK
jgi:hypothetical protein